MRKTKELENRIEKLESKVDKLSEMLGIKCWDTGFWVQESEAENMTPIFRDSYVSNDDVLKALMDKLGFQGRTTSAKDAGFVLEKKVDGLTWRSDIAPFDKPMSFFDKPTSFKDLHIAEMNERRAKEFSDTFKEIIQVLIKDINKTEDKEDTKEEEKTKTSSKKK